MGQLLTAGHQPAGDVENPGGPNNPEVSWWCRLLARVVAIFGAAVAIFSGIWVVVSVSPICIIAGILQIIFALLVLMMEAPICFTWAEVSRPVATFAENRTFFQRAIVYCIFGVIPIAMCFGLSTLFGAGLIFAAGVLYGLMGLGKKADRDQMGRNAAASDTTQPYTQQPTKADDNHGLVDNEGQFQ